MKKNFVTAFLVIVTLSVWLAVFYRIFNREEKVVIHPDRTVRKEVLRKDTLLLNYRNPFRGAVVSKKSITAVKPPTNEIEPPPTFAYKGTIKSHKGLFLMINDTILRPKDKINRYTITKIYKDSILVRKGNQTFTIRKI